MQCTFAAEGTLLRCDCKTFHIPTELSRPVPGPIGLKFPVKKIGNALVASSVTCCPLLRPFRSLEWRYNVFFELLGTVAFVVSLCSSANAVTKTIRTVNETQEFALLGNLPRPAMLQFLLFNLPQYADLPPCEAAHDMHNVMRMVRC